MYYYEAKNVRHEGMKEKGYISIRETPDRNGNILADIQGVRHPFVIRGGNHGSLGATKITFEDGILWGWARLRLSWNRETTHAWVRLGEIRPTTDFLGDFQLRAGESPLDLEIDPRDFKGTKKETRAFRNLIVELADDIAGDPGKEPRLVGEMVDGMPEVWLVEYRCNHRWDGTLRRELKKEKAEDLSSKIRQIKWRMESYSGSTGYGLHGSTADGGTYRETYVVLDNGDEVVVDREEVSSWETKDERYA